MSEKSPRQMFDRLIEAAVGGAWDELVELYASDVVIEMPFAPSGISETYPALSATARNESALKLAVATKRVAKSGTEGRP